VSQQENVPSHSSVCEYLQFSQMPVILNNKMRMPFLLRGSDAAISLMMQPARECTIMQKLAMCFRIAFGSLTFATGSAQAADLQGSWSGGGQVSFASGRESVRCRAQYSRRSNEGYVVRAVCATASGRAAQTASLSKVSDNRYRGTFYNSEYGISGTILVNVRGNTQSVRLTSDAGWALLNFSR
jgi:hypothetical protein